MKKILIPLLLLLGIPILVFGQIIAIKWQSNLDFARKLAQSKNQPIVMFFIEKPPGALSSSVFTSVFTNDLIIDKINNNFVPVLVEGNAMLEREYNIQDRFPTLLVLNKNNEEMDRLHGVIDINGAYSMLDNAQNNHAKLPNYSATGNTSTSSATSSITNGVFSFTDGTGKFIKDGKKWTHQTSFYSIQYTQTKNDNEDARHYYLVSEDYLVGSNKKVNIAIPKVVGRPVYIWSDESSRWEAVPEKVITITDKQ